MALINTPPGNSPVDDQNQVTKRWAVTSVWLNFFNQVFRICSAQTQSGTWAQRPTTDLYPGRAYFATDKGASSKGMKVFVDKDSTGWVDGAGTTVS